ncbi:acyl carrier protein [Agaribacterium sp. ZY112]|uniref:acyl carrier protein n=1 Tax=Agaribacterium sp. ZY112 TaxID=3233574 RepID=UPI003525B86D
MQNKDEIYAQMVALLEELFELDPADISPESELFGDLDIDSIDAVDMIVRLKQITGKRIEPSAFKNVRTVGDVVDAVDVLVNSSSETDDPEP